MNEKGYIVTNNHVIDEADDIEITLDDNRVFKADVIGVNPATDLTLLKIDAENLRPIPLADSDTRETAAVLRSPNCIRVRCVCRAYAKGSSLPL